MCLALLCASATTLPPAEAGEAGAERRRLFVVDSYHQEYLWSQKTHRGFSSGLLRYGYLDTEAQAEQLTATDRVESSRAVIRKVWMDTKRKHSKEDIAAATEQIAQTIKSFKPDLLFLGDDNAVNYLGNQFLDTELPIVFWGVNNTPIKYGLVDRADRPGHNVTGVVELGYYVETLRLLSILVPSAKTFAILSDKSETGRSHWKAIEALAQAGQLPLELVEVVSTIEFAVWKQEALQLQERVDAFVIVQYNALKDEQGVAVSGEEVATWYLANVRKPEAAVNAHFVEEGLLCTANDPAHSQGFDAVTMAHDILSNGRSPATYPPIIREEGTRLVNVARARQLGIAITRDMGIERYVGETLFSETAEAPPLQRGP